MNKKKTYILLVGILLCMLLFVYTQQNKLHTSESSKPNTFTEKPDDAQEDLEELLEKPTFNKDNDSKGESFSAATSSNYVKNRKNNTLRTLISTSKKMPELVWIDKQESYATTANTSVPFSSRKDVSATYTNSPHTPSTNMRSISNASSLTGGIPKKSLSRDEREVEKEISPDMRRSLTQLTYQEQKDLNFQIERMSSAVDRAILRAIAPKNKQDELVEKYLLQREQNKAENEKNSEQTIGGFPITSPEGKILHQLAGQGKNMVQSIQNAFGEQAGAEAAQIMQEFQQEMQEILSGPGTMAEKQERAQKLNEKYNKKLQDLSKKEGKKKLDSQLQKEKQEYVNKLKQAYGSKAAEAMQPALEQYLTKRAELYTQRLGDAEFIEKEGLLRQEFEETQRKILAEQHVGGTINVTELQNQKAREKIEDEAQQIEAGKAYSPRYIKTSQAQQTEIKTLEENRDTKIVPQFHSQQAQAQARQIMNNLIADKKELEITALQEEWSVHEYETKYMELVDKANESIKNLHIQETEQQYNAKYEAYYQNLPEEKKTQYRAVWETFNRQRASLQREQLTQAQLDARMQDIQDREQQAFARIE